MDFLLATIGSHGDVHPLVGVGRALRARGHGVHFLVQPYFQRLVQEAGLSFIPVGERFDLAELARMPHLMSAQGSAHIIRDLIIPEVPNQYRETLAAIDRVRPAAVLTHHLCFGAGWAATARGIPLSVACLSPLMWLAKDDPCIYLSIVGQNPGRLAVASQRWLGRYASRWLYDRPLNRHRHALGLQPRTDHITADVKTAPQVLGLWSGHFRGPFPDDPPAGRICGFVWFDRHQQSEHAPAEIERFLDEGEPPIIFTLGSTAVHVAGPFYEAAAGACAMLGRRGMLLTGRPEYAPRDLPPGVRAFTYAPYSAVLHRGLATVHHGGVGTTAQAMRAGRPTVIIPFAHDQFDNAARAARLGLSATLARRKISAPSLAAALRSVLDTPTPAARAAAMGAKLAAEDGAAEAAGYLEKLAEYPNRH